MEFIEVALPHTHTKGYKYRIYPTKLEEQYLLQVFGTVRYIYNYCLDKHTKAYEAFKADPTLPAPKAYAGEYYKWHTEARDQQAEAAKLDPEQEAWLGIAPAMAVIGKLRHLEQAFKNTFRRIKLGDKPGFPSFKSRDSKQSMTLSGPAFRVQDGRLWLAKLPSTIKVKWSRELPSEPSSVTVSRTPSGEYYASFVCKYTPVRLPQLTTEVGIDVGVRTFATLSTGEKIASPRHYQILQKRQARLQRKLAKQTKGSNSSKRTRTTLARTYAKVTNQRHDFQHKVTTKLISENQVICIEDLNVQGMVKNRNLAKSIITSGFTTFFNYLEYKAKEQHRQIVKAPRFFPSTNLCSCCHKQPSEKIKLSVKTWACEYCGAILDRDVNAAKNLLYVADQSRHVWSTSLKTVFSAPITMIMYQARTA